MAHLTKKEIDILVARCPAFYRRVYYAACHIPPGETRSYEWAARKAGCRAAARAVGNALHANPYPLLIPCHRIVPKKGPLGGYSRGRALKRMLLQFDVAFGSPA